MLDRLAERLVTRVCETIELDAMAFLLANERGDFEPLHVYGLEDGVPRLPGASGIGGRVGAGDPVRLDDPMAATRFTAEEIEFWRDAGIYYFVPCVSKGSAVAVLVLGRRQSGEPLTSEDLSLVTAVASQAGVAIENGRLYRQLHLKASELDRLSAFNENILESLDDGLMVLGLDGRVIRWNQALEQLYGPSREDALGRPVEQLFDPPVAERAAPPAARSSRGRHGLPRPAQGPWQSRWRSAAGQHHHRAAAADGPDPAALGQHRHLRGHHRAHPARGAVAHLREDGVARPARRRASPTR